MVAERVADAVDQANGGAAVEEAVLGRRGPRSVPRSPFQGAEGVGEDLENLLAGKDAAGIPQIVAVERHEFDESQLHAVPSGELGQGHDLVLGVAPNGQRIELGLPESHSLGGGNAIEDSGELVPAGDLVELARVERIEADVQPAEPCGLQGLGVLGQEDSVGRHRQIIDTRHARQHLHQPADAPADQRFAAG